MCRFFFFLPVRFIFQLTLRSLLAVHTVQQVVTLITHFNCLLSHFTAEVLSHFYGILFSTTRPIYFAAQCNVNNFFLCASIATAAAVAATAACSEGVSRPVEWERGERQRDEAGWRGKSSAVVSLDINVICGCCHRRRCGQTDSLECYINSQMPHDSHSAPSGT